MKLLNLTFALSSLNLCVNAFTARPAGCRVTSSVSQRNPRAPLYLAASEKGYKASKKAGNKDKKKKKGPSVFLPIGKLKTHRAGYWLPKDDRTVGLFLTSLRERVAKSPKVGLAQPVEALNELVRSDPALYGNAQAMFYEANVEEEVTPLETAPVQDWEEFIELLNYIVENIAPEFYNVPGTTNPFDLVGFPINALLDWPMGTLPGFSVFSNADFNEKMADVLTYWTKFLTSGDSTYTLKSDTEDSIAWLDEAILTQLLAKVNEAVNSEQFTSFEEVFKCDPSDPTYGFENWDQFFIREFNDNARPVSEPDNVLAIANACESAPLQVARRVKLEDTFWLKDQNYSLKDMIDFEDNQHSQLFEDGTVYQAFLSALSFHQWRSPVTGVVVASYNIPGTYYLQSYFKGFDENDGGAEPVSDPCAPNDSQPYLASVAARSVIVIDTGGSVGKVAFIGIGMAEVGSCENYVNVGDTISKGDPIGTFHFGGSTHCLVFQPHVNVDFIDYIDEEASINAPHNIAVSSTIAYINAKAR